MRRRKHAEIIMVRNNCSEQLLPGQRWGTHTNVEVVPLKAKSKTASGIIYMQSSVSMYSSRLLTGFASPYLHSLFGRVHMRLDVHLLTATI